MTESTARPTPVAPTDGGDPAAHRLGLLALVLALAAVAALIGAVAQAWSLSHQEFTAADGEQLKHFLRLVAFFGGSYLPVLFMAGAFVAHVVGNGGDRSDASRVTLWICFIAGLAVAALAVAAAADALILTGDSNGARVTFGYDGEGFLVRFGTVLPTLGAAAVSVIVSWCAFKALPISQSPPPSGADAGSDAVVDAEEA